MDLRKWKHAVTLAEEGSFAKAAARLHLTQPALTRSIQALEKELGVVLFDRQHSGAYQTVAGRLLIEKARELLRISNGLRHEAELIRDTLKGNLTFGSSSIAAQALLPKALSSVLKNPNNYQIEVDTQPYHVLLESLLNETIEFFISYTKTLQSRTDIDIEPLGTLPLAFFVRRDHPLQEAGAAKTTGQIQQYPLVSHVLSDYHYNKKLGNESDLIAWPSRMLSENASILKTVTVETDAVLMTAHAVVAEELAEGKLVSLKSKALGPKRFTELGVVSLHNRSLSPLAKRVIDAIKDEMKQASISGGDHK